jgi:hypothetical protein
MRYLLAALLPAATLADPCEKTLSGKPCDACVPPPQLACERIGASFASRLCPAAPC